MENIVISRTLLEYLDRQLKRYRMERAELRDRLAAVERERDELRLRLEALGLVDEGPVPQYRPFSDSGQAGNWFTSNCDCCVFGNANRETGACDIEQALALAYLDDGAVSEDIAQRMGYLKPDGTRNGAYVWPCTEVEWTDDRKAEVLARKEEV